MTDPTASPMMDHLIELRKRLLWCLIFFCGAFIACYPLAEHIFGFLVHPLASAMDDSHRKLIYTSLTEAFVTYMKVTFFAATFLSFPMIAIQIWRFVAPGLYKIERNVLLPFLWVTPLLFLIGGAFAYYLILPPFFEFCLNYETPSLGGVSLQLEAKINEYLSTVMQIILAFGMGFELPVVLVLLGRVGIVSSGSLKKHRKYAFLLIAVAAAILTPPDILSMVALLIPLYSLYEISILLIQLQEKKSHV